MDQDLAEIIVIMDASGSMAATKADAIGGFNEMLAEQKKQPGRAKLTLTQFNTKFSMRYNGEPLQGVHPLTDGTYIPGGMTALLDAIGKTVHEVGARLASTPEHERPGKVIVVIITDGQENSSREYSKKQVREAIECQQKDYHWHFMFLGANVDSFAEAGGLGISAHMTANYAASAQGVRSSYCATSGAMASIRSSGTVAKDWSKDIKSGN